jgi:excinuclease ABC subunit A
VKLALELSRRATGQTLYVLDEPTTGLHFSDIELLTQALLDLREAGNSIIIIEHNLELVACADWVIDMGPEGGSGGGLVVAEGTPEQVADNPQSHTGVALREVLESLEDSKARKAKAPQAISKDSEHGAKKVAAKKAPAIAETKAADAKMPDTKNAPAKKAGAKNAGTKKGPAKKAGTKNAGTKKAEAKKVPRKASKKAAKGR